MFSSETSSVLYEGKLYRFGSNSRGQIGDSQPKKIEKKNYYYPEEIKFFTGKKIQNLDSSNHVLVLAGNINKLTLDNILYGFGKNDYGQLGLGNTKDQYFPTKIPFFEEAKIEKIRCGENFSFVLLEKNQLFCFGSNFDGELGFDKDNVSYVSKPKIIRFFKDKKIKEIACGVNHSFVLLEDERLYGIGSNSVGQLGVYDDFVVDYPLIDFFLGKEISKISCGSMFTYVLTTDNQLFTFGSNDYAQLGLGDQEIHLEVNKTQFFKDENILDIECGYKHASILTNRGLYMVGFNSCNLDMFSSPIILVPEFIELNFIVKEMKGYKYHSFLISQEQKFYSFGKNDFGQLGVGNFTSPVSLNENPFFEEPNIHLFENKGIQRVKMQFLNKIQKNNKSFNIFIKFI